jgi:fermentation-respiration switch protein FrsA (DUF1100 family)
MITDYQIADLCNSIYGQPGSNPVTWDHLDPGTDSDFVCWGLKRFPEAWVAVFRGSFTLIDWLRDLCAVANPLCHDDIGPVSPGFYSGMRTVQREMLAIIGSDPVILAGHSLGAARASILAGLMVTTGRPPIGRVVFGEPKPGFGQLARILANLPDNRSYRNAGAGRHDTVTDLPLSVPPEEYVHPTDVIDVSAPPPPSLWSTLGMFSYHHMPLYVQGVKNGATPS